MAFDSLPEWQPIRALPPDEQQRAFAAPDVRARLIHDAQPRQVQERDRR